MPFSPSTRQKSLFYLAPLLVYGWISFYYHILAVPHRFTLFSEGVMWLNVALLSLAYLWGYRLLRRTSPSFKSVLLLAVAVITLAVSIPPFHSTYLFGDINRGWQQVHYHANPYVYTIDQVPGWSHDRMITNHWVNNPSPYGFFFIYLAKGLTSLGHGHLSHTVYVFKLMNALAFLLTGLLIAGHARRRNQPAAQLFYWFVFNPLLLIHGLANGHNDILMGFFIALSAFCLLSQNAWGRLGAFPALLLGTLVKYASIILFPVTLFYLIRQKDWRTLIGGLTLAVIIFLLCSAPYLPDWRHFQLDAIHENILVSHGSIHSSIFSLIKTILSESWSWIAHTRHWSATVSEQMWYAFKEQLNQMLKNMLLTLYACGMLYWLKKRIQLPAYTGQHWLEDSIIAMLGLIFFASLKCYPWYLGMFFPLGLLLPFNHRLQHILIVLSLGQILSITFVGQAHIINFWLMTGIPFIYILKNKQVRINRY